MFVQEQKQAHSKLRTFKKLQLLFFDEDAKLKVIYLDECYAWLIYPGWKWGIEAWI